MSLRSSLWLLLVPCAAACGPNHIGPFTPREREYDPGEYAQADPANAPSEGSLFSDGRGGFLEDTRAVRVGDVVLVKVDEVADAQGGATTSLSRENTANLGITALLGLVPTIKRDHPMIDPEALLEFLSSSDFSGKGDTARSGSLQGTIAVRVTRELPNGDLFIEGTKVLMINNEEYHLYLSGLVRPADIGNDNSVASTRIADAQIEFTGRGDVADQVE
ncbi:MAG: flagellar basal body L-ring protein FlgH, partial [Myxococcales bacterium]|nr:flagellar basal body L-ring protein FlgH [Myxococcales bacterium]